MAELQAKKGGFAPPICFLVGILPSAKLTPFLCLVHVLLFPKVHKAFRFSFLPWYHLHFLYSTFPGVFPCAICFIWRCTSSNNARTIIMAFLVSSRSSVLLADNTSGIVSSIPVNCHNNGIYSRFSNSLLAFLSVLRECLVI